MLGNQFARSRGGKQVSGRQLNPVPTGSTECMEGCGLKVARSSKGDRCMESVGSRGAVQVRNARVKNVAVCASTRTIWEVNETFSGGG